MSTTKTSKTTPRSGTKPTDATKLLEADHKTVKALFKEYDKLVEDGAGAGEKQVLAQQICTELKVHTTIEEELFYPAARDVLGEDEDLVDEADVEHAGAKELIAQIEASSPDDQHYDAKVKVLSEQIDHHVKEEEGEMFPKLRKTELDLTTLGEAMLVRKDEVASELESAQHA